MKLRYYLYIILLFLTACSHIDEDERLIYVEPAQQIATDTTTVRYVLLEDFTGQMCVNCPSGTEVIEQLQQSYGDRLIAVGIHSGPLGFKGNATTTGLATPLGDEYYSHWQLEYQPVGLVDRHGAVNYTDWVTKVREEMTKTSTVKIELEATLSNGQVNISVQETSLNKAFNGKLQVWVLEDSITATQKMPDGSVNRQYVHNHVLRSAVNGNWGEDVVISANETKTHNYQQPVDAAWNTTRLSIVAFVYDSKGVEQAAKKDLLIEN